MKKTIIILAVAIIALLGVWGYVRFIIGGDEDTWICENGRWVKHGNPSSAQPLTGCGESAALNEAKTNVANANTADSSKTAGTGALDPGMFQWSTMSQGPYRDKITYATSPDLLNWTPSGKILAEHASVPGAVYKDGQILVYFVDVTENGKPEQLGFVSSSDNGKTWSQPQLLTVAGIGNRAVADPDPVLLADGRIRLYYFDINEPRLNPGPGGQEPANRIYSLISSDGLNFTQEEGVRFQRPGVFDPDVEKTGDIWRMYVGDVQGNKVISATSADGVTFTEEGIAYQAGAVPDVFYANGQYYLFTAGIGMATSPDGQQFTDIGKRFSDTNYRITADPSVVKLNAGSYLMLYKVQS